MQPQLLKEQYLNLFLIIQHDEYELKIFQRVPTPFNQLRGVSQQPLRQFHFLIYPPIFGKNRNCTKVGTSNGTRRSYLMKKKNTYKKSRSAGCLSKDSGFFSTSCDRISSWPDLREFVQGVGFPIFPENVFRKTQI